MDRHTWSGPRRAALDVCALTKSEAKVAGAETVQGSLEGIVCNNHISRRR